MVDFKKYKPQLAEPKRLQERHSENNSPDVHFGPSLQTKERTESDSTDRLRRELHQRTVTAFAVSTANIEN